MARKEFTDEFQEKLDIINKEYSKLITQLDTLEFLGKDEREFTIKVTREELEKKLKAYEYLFPFFVFKI